MANINGTVECFKHFLLDTCPCVLLSITVSNNGRDIISDIKRRGNMVLTHLNMNTLNQWHTCKSWIIIELCVSMVNCQLLRTLMTTITVDHEVTQYACEHTHLIFRHFFMLPFFRTYFWTDLFTALNSYLLPYVLTSSAT
jgi:hypothetical protein